MEIEKTTGVSFNQFNSVLDEIDKIRPNSSRLAITLETIIENLKSKD